MLPRPRPQRRCSAVLRTVSQRATASASSRSRSAGLAQASTPAGRRAVSPLTRFRHGGAGDLASAGRGRLPVLVVGAPARTGTDERSSPGCPSRTGNNPPASVLDRRLPDAPVPSRGGRPFGGPAASAGRHPGVGFRAEASARRRRRRFRRAGGCGGAVRPDVRRRSLTSGRMTSSPRAGG
jgi:hypothetical protein